MFTPVSRACGYRTASGLGKWLSRDPIAEQGGANLYRYVANNPVSFADLFGLALYPADFVGPLQQGDWRQTIFNGYENPRYQQNDQAIHDWVNDFNANKDVYCGCSAAQQGGVPDVTFDQIKSWLIQETGGGDRASRTAWSVDPAQVNNPGDWTTFKDDVGLPKPNARNEGTLNGNLMSAMAWLCRKGFGTSGQPARNRPGGFFDGWWQSFQRYNGRTDLGSNGQEYGINYADQITGRANNPGVHYPIELP